MKITNERIMAWLLALAIGYLILMFTDWLVINWVS